MYKRLSSIMFPIMTIMFIGAAFWGYQEHQEKNTVLMKAENQYQRAFGELSYYVGKLNQELGNTLAVNSTSMNYHRKGLVNVWRLTTAAQNQISQLPLSYVPFNDAENFLSRMSNFAYKTAVRDLSKQPLTDKEFDTLKSLYKNSSEISAELNNLEHRVLNSNLRWMDVELALASEQTSGTNPVVSSLRTVNTDVGQYPEMDWGPAVNSMYNDHTVQMLSGNMITADEVKQKAAHFANVDLNQVEIAENGKGTNYATYTAKVKSKSKGDADLKLTYTYKGGHLLALDKNSETKQKNITIEEAKKIAEQFLTAHGYENMVPVSYSEYYNVGSFNYVQTQNDVKIYPDKVMIKVSLDGGEVTGFQANDFVYHHKARTIEDPIISQSDAEKALNPQFKVTEKALAVIDGEMGSEVLCYEFTGRMNNQVYRIYINSETGVEETIEQLSKEEQTAFQS